MVARRRVDVVAGVTAAGGAHVLRVERILEREHHAVHRHLLEVRTAAVQRVELCRALERIGLVAERVAHRRRARRQRAERGMAVEVALAGDRTLAADVDRRQCIDLACIRDAGDHAVLLRDLRIGSGRLHPSEFDRRPGIAVQIGQPSGGLQRLRRERQRRTPAHRTRRRRDFCPVLRDQKARHAIERAHPPQVVFDDLHAGGASVADRLLHLVDGGLFQAEGFAGCAGWVHGSSAVGAVEAEAYRHRRPRAALDSGSWRCLLQLARRRLRTLARNASPPARLTRFRLHPEIYS